MYPGQIHKAMKQAAMELKSSLVPNNSSHHGPVHNASVNRGDILHFSIKAKKLKAMDWNGKSDPFVELYRLEQNGWIKVFTTTVQKATLKPIWANLSIPVELLCFGDPERSILVRCFDFDDGKPPDHIGDAKFSLRQLLSNKPKFKVSLMQVQQSKSRGDLSFYDVSLRPGQQTMAQPSYVNPAYAQPNPQYMQQAPTQNRFAPGPPVFVQSFNQGAPPVSCNAPYGQAYSPVSNQYAPQQPPMMGNVPQQMQAPPPAGPQYGAAPFNPQYAPGPAYNPQYNHQLQNNVQTEPDFPPPPYSEYNAPYSAAAPPVPARPQQMPFYTSQLGPAQAPSPYPPYVQQGTPPVFNGALPPSQPPTGNSYPQPAQYYNKPY